MVIQFEYALFAAGFYPLYRTWSATRGSSLFSAVHWLIVAWVAFGVTLTGALPLAPVAQVMPKDYTSLLWATMFGIWLFAELPTPWIWVGAPIIIASGLVIVWREHHLARRAALSAATAVPN